MAKAAKKAKSKAKAGFFTKLLLLILIAALGYQLHQLRGNVDRAQAEMTQLSNQVADQQQENDSLQEAIDQGGSKEEMEKIARQELGLVAPNEKVFYDVSN